MQITDSLQQFILDRRADAVLRDVIATLSLEAQDSLETIVVELDPSANTVREMLRLCLECAQRDNHDVSFYLGSPEVKRILFQELSKKEKQKLIRQYLEAVRYPQREKLQKEAVEAKKELTRKYGLQIMVPEELEGMKIEVSFYAGSVPEMHDSAKKVSELANDEALKKLYALLRGE